MADLLEQEMKQPLALIEALTPQGELDASGFSLAVCQRLLSTHADSGWQILFPIRARHAELMNASKVECAEHELLNLPTEAICPSEITSGMHIVHHGYIGKVVEVKRYESSEPVSNEPFVYIVKLDYVCGDIKMHNYFEESINNGTARGWLSSMQGNRLATFIRVIEGE
ncbi:hypothetical protein [Vibrio alginolyticus]|uniref:hypothetical protein n=1 Tax=Vibrio TaxID=662 RepID=UPI0006CA9823|nr:hypothetical protein [Vibrio alginolyticus]KPM98461.1 hypothetical protein AOG25_08430 [Vibrio alginolyticus]CAH7141077.1 conserved hypothetical protein [Vibrio chagasii]CAH7231941.1 conserved hypothetical protein [Vibrio chagasii]